jgi:hypothetical protein
MPALCLDPRTKLLLLVAANVVAFTQRSLAVEIDHMVGCFAAAFSRERKPQINHQIGVCLLLVPRAAILRLSLWS